MQNQPNKEYAYCKCTNLDKKCENPHYMPLYSSKPDTNKTLEVRFDCVYGILDTVVPKRAYTIVREDLLNFFRSELAREREEGKKEGLRFAYDTETQIHQAYKEATLAERKRVVEVIKGMGKDNSISPNQHDFRKQRERKGYNQALTDLIKKLEEKT